jgi:hypothetical protein
MPWNNVPKEKWDEMERCVNSRMKDPDFKPYKGKSKKESATAVCYVSIMGKKK